MWIGHIHHYLNNEAMRLVELWLGDPLRTLTVTATSDGERMVITLGGDNVELVE